MDTFTLFPLLPLELRRKIWAYTFQPRILEYRLTTIHVPGFVPIQIGDPTSYNQFTCTKPPPVPTALHVCHESRSFALEHYKRSAGGTDPPESLRDYPELRPRPVYFNPDIDIVGFENFHDSLQSAACWGPSRSVARGSYGAPYRITARGTYGAAPDFKDVRRLLLNATDWEFVGIPFIVGRNHRRGPKAAFFTEFFPALKEILLAQRFGGPYGGYFQSQSSHSPLKVTLARPEVWSKRCSMERDFRNIMAVRIPGWKAPDVRIVRSRLDMTEVTPSDLSAHGDIALEKEAIYEIIREYEDPPPPDYWAEFCVPAPEFDP